MQIQCPSCETKFVIPEPGEVTCPACMATFDCRPEPEPEPEHAYKIHREQRGLDLQIPDGGVQKNVSRYAVREGVYVGRYKSGVRYRRGDGTWDHIGSLPEIAVIFRMLGQEPLPAPATRAIAGWRGERPERGPEGPEDRAAEGAADRAQAGAALGAALGSGNAEAARAAGRDGPGKAGGAGGVPAVWIGAAVAGLLLLAGLAWVFAG